MQDGVEAPPEETLEALGKEDLGILDSQDNEIEDLSYATMFATTLTLDAAAKQPQPQQQQQQPDPAAAFSQPMRMDDPVIERPAASHVSRRALCMKRRSACRGWTPGRDKPLRIRRSAELGFQLAR